METVFSRRQDSSVGRRGWKSGNLRGGANLVVVFPSETQRVPQVSRPPLRPEPRGHQVQ